MKYDGAFWKATTERALSTFVQTYLGLWLAGDLVFNVFTFDWITGLGPALGAAILSVVKGMIAANTGNAGPSFANEVALQPDAPRAPRAGGVH